MVYLEKYWLCSLAAATRKVLQSCKEWEAFSIRTNSLAVALYSHHFHQTLQHRCHHTVKKGLLTSYKGQIVSSIVAIFLGLLQHI